MKKALFIFDYTGIMAQPWLEAGYECWLFDGQHKPGVTREGNLVKVGLWFDPYSTKEHVDYIKSLVGDDVAFIAGFPECTDLAVSGSRHFESKAAKNPAFQAEATELARFIQYLGDEFNCPWFAENPVSVLSSLWRKPNYSFHPYEYGGHLPLDDVHPSFPEYINARDAYPKKTCLWVGNGFVMPEKKPVPIDEGNSKQYMKLGGRSLKTKQIRSCTPRGFARAVFQANQRKINNEN